MAFLLIRSLDGFLIQQTRHQVTNDRFVVDRYDVIIVIFQNTIYGM